MKMMTLRRTGRAYMIVIHGKGLEARKFECGESIGAKIVEIERQVRQFLELLQIVDVPGGRRLPTIFADDEVNLDSMFPLKLRV